jgi:uncharacterized protein
VSDVQVSDQPEEQRYEVRVDGAHAGAAYYRPGEDALTFTHTEVDDAYEGRGIGSALAQGALDDVRRRGLRVVPQCPFIRGWIERHPAYADLVADNGD